MQKKGSRVEEHTTSNIDLKHLRSGRRSTLKRALDKREMKMMVINMSVYSLGMLHLDLHDDIPGYLEELGVAPLSLQHQGQDVPRSARRLPAEF